MQVISLFTSGVMLGLKLAQVTALPAMWGKLSKWRSRAQPLCEAADAEGTELHEAPADTTDAPVTAEEYAAMLHQIEAAILALAGKAGPQVAADRMHLRKLAHKLAMLAANPNLPSAKPGAKPDAPPAGPQVLPSPTRPCTGQHRGTTVTHRMRTSDHARSPSDYTAALHRHFACRSQARCSLRSLTRTSSASPSRGQAALLRYRPCTLRLPVCCAAR